MSDYQEKMQKTQFEDIDQTLEPGQIWQGSGDYQTRNLKQL